MKRYPAVLFAAAMMIALVPVSVSAQPFGPGAGPGAGMPGPGRAFRDAPRGGMAAGPAGFRELIGLNLTAEQREKIQALLEENREVQQQEAEAAREEMNAIGKELDALMDADVYDEAAAQQLFARRSALTNERQILRQKLQHRIVHEILTPEQREALANRQANTAAFGRGRGAGFGPGRGAGFGPGEGFGDGFGPGGGFGPGAGGGGMMLRDGSCIED